MNTATFSNKLLPLTLHQLLIAQQQYKRRRIPCYDNTTYQFIYVIARIVNISGFQFQITDCTVKSLDITIVQNSIRKSSDLIKDKYYRFVFQIRKNLPYNDINNIFGFQVIGLKRISSNQIIKHMTQCIQQKINRSEYHKKYIQTNQANNQNNNNNIHTDNLNNSFNNISSSIYTNNNTLSSKLLNKKTLAIIKQQIKNYCRSIKQFDEQHIFDTFKQKDITIKQVKQIIDSLCDDSLVMDLGLVYEWVGEDEKENQLN